MTRELPPNLALRAQVVAQEHEEHEAARADRFAAEGDLLAAATSAVLPALRALSSRIVTARVVSKAGRTDTGAIGVPGVFIGPADTVARQLAGPVCRAGAWSGRDLFLLQDGTWVVLVYDGVDATMQDGVSEWGSDMVQLTPHEVVEMIPVDVVLDALARALDQQLAGSKARRTAETEARTQRIRALVTLVRSSL